MDSYKQYKKLRNERLQHSLNYSSSKLEEDLNKSTYQNEYIDKFLERVQKSPESKQNSLQPPVLLLKNKRFQLNTPQKQSKQFATKENAKQSANSAVHDYIEMKKRQQILEGYVNESKIMDSAQQKMKHRLLFQQHQALYSGNKQTLNEEPCINKINSSFNLTQQDLESSFSNRPVKTEANEGLSKSPLKPSYKCFRSFHKYLHQAQTQQVIQNQIESEFEQLSKKENMETLKSKQIDGSIQFNNSALTQLIKPYFIQSNKSDLRCPSFKQISTTPSKPFFLEQKQLQNSSMGRQLKDNSCKNLFDLRSTQIFKEQSKIGSDHYNSNTISVSEMYANKNSNSQKKVSCGRRNIRSLSHKAEEITQRSISIPVQQQPASRRYNQEEEENCGSSSNESTQNLTTGSNSNHKTRKQTISKLINYFNTIADFKQDSRESIKLNRIESRNFLFSQHNNNDLIENYAKIANNNKKQIFTPQSEDINSLETNSLTNFEEELKNKCTREEEKCSAELSPIITDLSIDRIDFKSNMLENMIDSTDLIQSSTPSSSSVKTSYTVSPAIRPRYSIKQSEDEEDFSGKKKCFTLNDRPSKKNFKTEQNSNKKSRKLINSSSVAPKDIQKSLKEEEISQQIFLNKSFVQNKLQKRKLKKQCNIINQSIDADQPRKIQLKKSDNKIKLRPIDFKQNSNNLSTSQQDINQSSSIFDILKAFS